MGLLTTFFTAIGAISLSVVSFKTARTIYIYIRPSSLPRYLHTSSSGQPPWALVTGASDGIGKAYASELARHGFNVILHGRNITKLQSVQKCIASLYPKIQTRVMVLDAATCSASDIKAKVDELRDLHLTVLINNVGTGTTPDGHVFSNLEAETPANIDFLLNANARFPALLTHFALPLLLSHSRPALILTMGSISDVGSPYLSIYSGTKAFDTTFSRALRKEMMAEGRDVEVLAIMTLQVTGTASDGASKRSVMSPDAGDFARCALARVGCGREVVEGCWAHCLVRSLMGVLPEKTFSRILVNSVKEEMQVEGKCK